MVRRGSDKGLSSVSTLFTSLYTLLQRKHSRMEADRLVRPLSLHPLSQRCGMPCSKFVRFG